RGILKLNKTGGAIAIPEDLTFGGSAPEHSGNRVILGGDGQFSTSSVVTLAGSQPSFFDLDGHGASFSKLNLSPAATVRTGKDGALNIKQLIVDGKRFADGVYKAPQRWLDGTGTVTVDARVNVKGSYSNPDVQIG